MSNATDFAAMVERCPFAAGVIDLDDLRYVATNDAVAELLDLDTRPDGENILQFVQSPAVAGRLRLLRGNGIHWFETSWELRAKSGVPFVRSGWAVSIAGHPNLVVAVAAPEGPRQEAMEFSHRAAAPLAVVGLDNEWRILRVSKDIEALLGWRADEWRGRPLLGEMHPADVARFCEATFRTQDEYGGISIEARFRARSGSWCRLDVGVIAEGSTSELPSVLVTLSPCTAVAAPVGNSRWSEWAVLSSGLEDARVMFRDMLVARMPTVDLSARQFEIVYRLFRGERVSTVAAELYLSKSTVRNHLGGAFQKFGVHSQEELLRRLRRSLDGPSN